MQTAMETRTLAADVHGTLQDQGEQLERINTDLDYVRTTAQAALADRCLHHVRSLTAQRQLALLLFLFPCPGAVNHRSAPTAGRGGHEGSRKHAERHAVDAAVLLLPDAVLLLLLLRPARAARCNSQGQGERVSMVQSNTDSMQSAVPVAGSARARCNSANGSGMAI